MTNKIRSASWCCSLLAAICLVLGAIAAPVGNVRADDPPIFEAGYCPKNKVCTTDGMCSGICAVGFCGCFFDDNCPNSPKCCDCTGY